MQQFTYTIKDRDGIHARPAGALIKEAKSFKSKITIDAHGKTADLKGGIFALMGLGIRCGWEVTVTMRKLQQLSFKSSLLPPSN